MKVWVYVDEEYEKEFDKILQRLGFTVRKGSQLELRENFRTIETNPKPNRRLALKYYSEDFDEIDEAYTDLVHYVLFVD